MKKPMLVAKFLQQTRGLNKAVVGDFLSKDRPFNAEVREIFFGQCIPCPSCIDMTLKMTLAAVPVCLPHLPLLR